VSAFYAHGVPGPHYELTAQNGGNGVKLAVSITDGFSDPLGGSTADDVAEGLVAYLESLPGVTSVFGAKTEVVHTQPFPS
jgi:hypothetical protein